MSAPLPAVSVCGWSGSGKTTLIAELVARFKARGLSVGVIKHHVHGAGTEAGRAHKDSDQFFVCGADTVLVTPQQILIDMHPGRGRALPELVSYLDAHHDLILCEGFKRHHFALKIWLQKSDGETPPAEVPGIHRVLGPREDRVAIVEALVASWLEARLRSTPVLGGVLAPSGGPKLRGREAASWQRRNSPSDVLRTLRASVQEVLWLGPGRDRDRQAPLPELPSVPGLRPPLAEMVAAMRWRPEAAWIFVAQDHPAVSGATIEWLSRQRRPGLWGVVVRGQRTRSLRPVLALLEPRARTLLETASSLSSLVADPRIATLALSDEALAAG